EAGIVRHEGAVPWRADVHGVVLPGGQRLRGHEAAVVLDLRGARLIAVLDAEPRELLRAQSLAGCTVVHVADEVHRMAARLVPGASAAQPHSASPSHDPTVLPHGV